MIDYGKYILRYSVTGLCQMHCNYCDHGEAGRQIDADEVCEILEACLHAGVRMVHWTGGEPTLRPDFTSLVAHAKAIGFAYQKMTTNGAKLLKLAKPLRAAGIDRINISLDTIKRDKFNSITNTLLFDKVIAGVDLVARTWPLVKVNMCVTRDNIDEVLDLVEFAGRCLGKVVPKFMEMVPCGNEAAYNTEAFGGMYVGCPEVKQLIESRWKIKPTVSPLFSLAKCKHYETEHGVVFGLNPNESIDYACHRDKCRYLRMDPHGSLADCSVNLKHLTQIAGVPLNEKKRRVAHIVELKTNRTPQEWDTYRHKQKHYPFWRFGEPLEPKAKTWDGTKYTDDTSDVITDGRRRLPIVNANAS